MNLLDRKDLPEFQCPHEKGLVPYDQTHSDYSPIDRQELVELMTTAIRSSDPNLRNFMQGRLVRAVPDMECPRQIEGPVSRKKALVDKLYIKEITDGPTSTFISRFYRIINAKSVK